MNIETAKQIRLQDYLQSIGHSPVKASSEKLYYSSPFRDENVPSFKVNTKLNLWYDFGVGRGGNIIALAEELYHSKDISYLLAQIDKNAPAELSIRLSYRIPKIAEPAFTNIEVLQLTHPALMRYITERKIDMIIAQQQCNEIHFKHNDKAYFAIGFTNNVGGYELRNSFFKGCIAPKSFTLIKAKVQSKTCLMFEGFMDYLSYMTLLKQGKGILTLNDDKSARVSDYIILNSVTNLQKAKSLLTSYEHIVTLFDNDRAGQTACAELSQELGDKVKDDSVAYSKYKDINDLLCNKPIITQQQRKGKGRGI
jgi:hypothetical protein